MAMTPQAWWAAVACTLTCMGSGAAPLSAPRQAPVSSASTPAAVAAPFNSAASKNAEEEEDRRRNEARAYPLGTIKRIQITGTRFYDADEKLCPGGPAHKLTPKKVRYFLEHAAPISQMALMNYYGLHGECSSQNVTVVFDDGRTVHLSFASESETAYISPIVNGKETDVFFYYCEQCAE